jgi:glucose-6-phosphate isomerase
MTPQKPERFQRLFEGASVGIEGLGIELKPHLLLASGLPLAWAANGVSLDALESALPAARRAWEGLREIARTGRAPNMTEAVRWPRLPFVEKGEPNAPEVLERIDAWATRVRECDVVVSFGIGGSYLGNRVLRDALLGPLWNELPREARGNRPELRFAGYHLDPAEARTLLKLLEAKREANGGQLNVHALAISKSGGTTETLGGLLAFLAAASETKIEVGFTALTDPGSVLGAIAKERGGDVLPFPDGIGGRWSVLSASGLVTAAATGVDVRALLSGAARVARAIEQGEGDPLRDPALLYGVLTWLHGLAGRTLSVFMPYSERLKCVSEWYVQLLAESLGKARRRDGLLAPAGRTPIVAVGTTDMHAQTQLHQEGPRDKVVTTIDVRLWGAPTSADRVPDPCGVSDPAAKKLEGWVFADLNTLAREANEEALATDGRPSCSIILERLEAEPLGGLLYLLMASVAYEGELLNVNAYDQPGVEAYKKIMKARLEKK